MPTPLTLATKPARHKPAGGTLKASGSATLFHPQATFPGSYRL